MPVNSEAPAPRLARKLDDFRKNPVVLTLEDYEHLSPLDQLAARVLARKGLCKVEGLEVSR